MFQSGFRTHHSTDAAVLKVVNNIRTNLDSNKSSVLVQLDLSAALKLDSLDGLSGHAGLSRIVFNMFT